MTHIAIIGAGFGALSAAKELRKHNKNIDITLVAPKAEFIYAPSLIWIPSDLRSGDDLRIPLDKFLTKYKVKFHQSTVTGLKNAARTVITDQGTLDNDALIIASGARFIKKLPGIEHAITICEGISAAERYRDQLKAMQGGTIAVGFGGNPKEPAAMRGGPMFELLFGLDTQLRREGRRDKFKIVFFNPAPKPGKRLGEKAVGGILREMKKRDIDMHLGHKMQGFSNKSVMTTGGEFDADMILFMPGMTGPAWLADSGLSLSAGGMVKANQYTQAENAPLTYVVGDSGSFPGPDWMPKQAHMADLQAVAAAKNVLAELDNKAIETTFKIELICIIDTLDKGILVFRNMKRTIVLPCRLFHYAKRFFEWLYLRDYR